MALDIHLNSTPLRHEIRGVDLNNLDEQTFKDIDDAYKTYGVVVIRDQKLTPDQQLNFSRRFGSLDRFVFDRFNMKENTEIFIF